MTSPYDHLLDILCRHISSINAQNILGRALRELRKTPADLGAEDLPRLRERLDRSLRLFLPPSAFASVQAELARMCAPSVAPAPERHDIRIEADIAQARGAVRDLCLRLAARRVVVQKVATIVSELARNIFMYTPGGFVEFVPSIEPRRSLLIRSVDHGAGIPNLDEILGGKYRSRTGLGVGLLGTKRLADRFTIETGSTGTHIEVEVVV